MNRFILYFFMLVLLMGCSSKSSDSNVSIREFDSESRSNSSFSLAEAASSQGGSNDEYYYVNGEGSFQNKTFKGKLIHIDGECSDEYIDINQPNVEYTDNVCGQKVTIFDANADESSTDSVFVVCIISDGESIADKLEGSQHIRFSSVGVEQWKRSEVDTILQNTNNSCKGNNLAIPSDFRNVTGQADLDADDKFVSSVSTDVNIETKSKVFCEPGKQLDSKIILKQIFLLPAGADSSGHTFLYRDGEVLSAYHEFREDDVIGIDIFQDLNENNNLDQDDDLDEYIRMSDIRLFSDKFQFSETVLGSVSYVFPIGSDEGSPTVSKTGCWMQLTLDFK